MNVTYEGDVLWSQIDANRHMRHSAYADFAAQARLVMLEKLGLDMATLAAYKIGPVMFREELFYLRECGLNDHLKVTAEVYKSRADASRWSIRHEIYRADGVKAAVIDVEGAWMDIEKRKLARLPQELIDMFMAAPKGEDYVLEVKGEPKA
jgi:acyl-CoA thioester hydrolase